MSIDLDLNTLGIAQKQKLTKKSLSIQETSNFNILLVLFSTFLFIYSFIHIFFSPHPFPFHFLCWYDFKINFIHFTYHGLGSF